MQTTTTFRHIEQSDALKSYAEEKLERVKKYIDEPIIAQTYMTVEKIRHIVEITLTAKGVTIKASEATNDMYASIDAVVDKIERQLRRYKERLKGHKPSTDVRAKEGKRTIVQAESLEQQQPPVVIKVVVCPWFSLHWVAPIGRRCRRRWLFSRWCGGSQVFS